MLARPHPRKHRVPKSLAVVWEGGRECTVGGQATRAGYPKPIKVCVPLVKGQMPSSWMSALELSPTPASKPVGFTVKAIKRAVKGPVLVDPKAQSNEMATTPGCARKFCISRELRVHETPGHFKATDVSGKTE